MYKKQLIGKRVKGFYFSEKEYPLVGYPEDLNSLIDVQGEIVSYDKESDSYDIIFDSKNRWAYPAELVLNNLLV